tara:strand:+ start:1665 stop:1967 length:303 start_codon:yes stop_codon:yes gene_type:complete
MAVSYTWTIPIVERNLSDGGITLIHWTCTGVDGDYSRSMSGTTAHSPDADADGFISYDKVTEENCITWAKSQIDVSNIETAIKDEINEVKTPISANGVPW